MARGERAHRRRCRRATPPRGSRSHLEWERLLHDGPLRRRVVARGVRRSRRLAVGVADLRGGVLPGRVRRSGSPRTASSCSPRRSSSSAPQAQQDYYLPRMSAARGPLVPGLVRAQRRVRPRRHHRRAVRDDAAGGWRLTGSEDVDDPWRVLHAPVRPVPHRRRGRTPPRPHVLPRPARRRGHDRPRLRPPRR